MFDVKLRLISMLGLLTVVVIISLALDYLNVLKRPVRLGLWIAILGISGGFALTLSAVLPENHFFGTVFSQVRTTQKVVALTFDDGPYSPYTEQILDILKENHVLATFFVIGQNAEKYPDLIRRMVAEGHQIGNHTYHHVDLLKADQLTIANEIDSTNILIGSLVGKMPQVVRPPHGFRDPVVMQVMQERGLKVVEWSVMSRDWTNPGVEIIVDRTIRQVQNGSVILLHDGDGLVSTASRAQTVEATRRIIQQLSEKGYKFVTVDEILAKPEDQNQ